MSGGPDSLALLLLAAENRDPLRAAGFRLHVATVDHRLRAGSATEAAFVARLARDLALPHRTLVWTGPKPAANVAAAARTARYRLLEEHAATIGAAAILTAHHEDDQIETHHLAALRGAGDRGLAGMRVVRDLRPGIHLLRPFLGVPGALLKAAVAQYGIAAVDDPANRDPRYRRARIRSALPSDPVARRRTLRDVAVHAARRDAEDAELARFLSRLRCERAVSVDDGGVLRLEPSPFRAAPPAVADLLLSRVLRAAGGAEYAPARIAVGRLAENLRRGQFAGATLGGARIAVDGTFTFFREYGRSGLRPQPFPQGCAVLFDRRFNVFDQDLNDLACRLKLAAFGATGRGNAIEKTLPVAIDADGRVAAAHPVLLGKLPAGTSVLALREEVSFRLFADLGAVADA